MWTLSVYGYADYDRRMFMCNVGVVVASEVVIVKLVPPVTLRPTPGPPPTPHPATLPPISSAPTGVVLPSFVFIAPTQSPTIAPTTGTPTTERAPDGSIADKSDSSFSESGAIWIPTAFLVLLIVSAVLYRLARTSSKVFPTVPGKDELEQYQVRVYNADGHMDLEKEVSLPSTLTLNAARSRLATAVNKQPYTFEYLTNGGGVVDPSQEPILHVSSIAVTGAKARAMMNSTNESVVRPVLIIQSSATSFPHSPNATGFMHATLEDTAEDTTSSSSETENELQESESEERIITNKPPKPSIPAVQPYPPMRPRTMDGRPRPNLPPMRSSVDLLRANMESQQVEPGSM